MKLCKRYSTDLIREQDLVADRHAVIPCVHDHRETEQHTIVLECSGAFRKR